MSDDYNVLLAALEIRVKKKTQSDLPSNITLPAYPCLNVKLYWDQKNFNKNFNYGYE